METSVLQAVGTATRRRILKLTWDQERAAGEIASHFDISWPAVSQNLNVLKEAGLIQERRDGNRRFYRTDREAMGPLEAVLMEMWKTDLDRLGRVAAREAKDR